MRHPRLEFTTGVCSFFIMCKGKGLPKAGCAAVSEIWGKPGHIGKRMLVVNGISPGPTIEANLRDRIVVRPRPSNHSSRSQLTKDIAGSCCQSIRERDHHPLARPISEWCAYFSLVGIPFATMLNSIHPGTNYYDGTFGITVCFSTLREFRAMVTSAYLAMWYPSKWR